MPTMIVRQPDGKLAAFDSKADDFVVSDMTEEEAFAFCREELDLGRRDSEEKVRSGVEDHVPWKVGVKGTGQERWIHALQQVAMQHGMATLRTRVAEMGFPDQDLSACDAHASHADEPSERHGLPG